MHEGDGVTGPDSTASRLPPHVLVMRLCLGQLSPAEVAAWFGFSTVCQRGCLICLCVVLCCALVCSLMLALEVHLLP